MKPLQRNTQHQIQKAGVTLLLPVLLVMLAAWSCGTTDHRPTLPWELPESPWRFEALLNEEPINVEIDTAWIHPQNGIRFILSLSTPKDWPYVSQFSIRPGIRSIPLDTNLVLNDRDRLDQFEWLSFHSIINESDDDMIVSSYRLNPESRTNYIRFTSLKEDIVNGRYRAIVEAEFEAVYYYEDPGRPDVLPHLYDWVQDWRQLPDTVRITRGRFETVLLDWEDWDYWNEQQ